MAKAKIITTLGPATNTKEAMMELIAAGADVFRLNMSHGDYDAATVIINNARAASDESGEYIPLFMDLRGPKLRIGKIEGEQVTLADGQDFRITIKPIMGSKDIVSTDYIDLPDDVREGSTILLDDGQIILKVLSTSDDEVLCRVETGGVLKSNKGMALPGVHVKIPALTDKDIKDVGFGIDSAVDGFMLSFVQKREDIHELHGVMRAKGKILPVIAKIETSSALQHLDDIAEVADGLLVARGDLGVELPIWQLPSAQKKIIETAHRHRKPVVVATEMLESMVTKTRPTRAEVTDVSNASLNGADLMMLSAETASGKYPFKAVKIMDQIAEEAEKSMGHEFREVCCSGRLLLSESVSYSAVTLASSLKASAIILYTMSGFTARIISYIRPDVPIYAFTGSKHIARYCNIFRDITPFILEKEPMSFDEFAGDAVKFLVSKKILKQGDTVVATNINSNPSGNRKSNIIRVFQC